MNEHYKDAIVNKRRIEGIGLKDVYGVIDESVESMAKYRIPPKRILANYTREFKKDITDLNYDFIGLRKTLKRIVVMRELVESDKKRPFKTLRHCPPDKELSSRGNCVKKCKPDQTRNAKTGRCKKA